MANDVVAAIKNADGKATFETVQGGKLYAMMENGKVKLKDASGNVATVTQADVNQSNGVVHVIDTIILPGK